MRTLSLCFFFGFFLQVFLEKPIEPPVPVYTINNMTLPAEMDKQVCISGTKYLDGKLYFASERCPLIFEMDPGTSSITKTILVQVNREFEMEGMTSYKNKLYLVSESIAAIYEVDIS